MQSADRDAFEKKQQEYVLLKMLMNGQLTFKLAEDAQLIVDDLNKLSPVEQADKLTEMAEYAPREITQSTMNRRFERLIGRTFSGISLKY